MCEEELDFGPRLIFEEKELPGGYAPRSILLAAREDVLFVGSKDGSIIVVEATPNRDQTARADLGQFKPPQALQVRGKDRSGVRALCEWDVNHILVGRGGGTVELLAWRDTGEIRPKVLLRSSNAPVRLITQLQEDRFLISVRETGNFLLRKDRRSFGQCQEDVAALPLSLRFAVPLRFPGDRTVWLLITDLGDLSTWSGHASDRPQKHEEIWQNTGCPAVISDIGLLRTEVERRVGKSGHASFLATDSGVYLIRAAADNRGDEDRRLGGDEVCLRLERLVLPGVGGVATALSYTENEEYCYLWVADSRGDSHLFWARNTGSAADLTAGPIFRSSGVRHLRSEALVCSLWTRNNPSSVYFAQARRNDRIVLGRYWEPGSTDRPGEWNPATRLRRLLSYGSWDHEKPSVTGRKQALVKALRELSASDDDELRKAELIKWPSHALLTELFERLGEDDRTRRLLLDALRSPHCAVAQAILDQRNRGDALFQATRLWTQSLLGVIHRSGGDREIAYLGLLRWLRRRQEEVRGGHKEDLISNLQTDLGFARKWGFYGDVNADRQDLVHPVEMLRA